MRLAGPGPGWHPVDVHAPRVGLMSDSTTSYACPYCRTTSSGAGTTCPNCGAPGRPGPPDHRSGWTELPGHPRYDPPPDRPVLGADHGQAGPGSRYPPGGRTAGVYFPQHNLLWQEPAVQVRRHVTCAGGWDRMRAGLPVTMLEAIGPGTISFSHDAAGEIVAIPLQSGAAVDVREHQLVAATQGVGYDWYDSGHLVQHVRRRGRRPERRGRAAQDGPGPRRPRYRATETSGATRCAGSTRWAARSTASPPARSPGWCSSSAAATPSSAISATASPCWSSRRRLLFKDPTVGMELHVEYPAAGVQLWRTWGNRYLWLRVTGPGRIGLQSSYDRLEDPGHRLPRELPVHPASAGRKPPAWA